MSNHLQAKKDINEEMEKMISKLLQTKIDSMISENMEMNKKIEELKMELKRYKEYKDKRQKQMTMVYRFWTIMISVLVFSSFILYIKGALNPIVGLFTTISSILTLLLLIYGAARDARRGWSEI